MQKMNFLRFQRIIFVRSIRVMSIEGRKTPLSATKNSMIDSEEHR